MQAPLSAQGSCPGKLDGLAQWQPGNIAAKVDSSAIIHSGRPEIGGRHDRLVINKKPPVRSPLVIVAGLGGAAETRFHSLERRVSFRNTGILGKAICGSLGGIRQAEMSQALYR
jgi:hypothetical protein